jgi:ferredoxin--NADP+ reductase
MMRKMPCHRRRRVDAPLLIPKQKRCLNRIERDVIMGFRSKEFVILEEEMKAVSTRLFLTTDDEPMGRKVCYGSTQ